MATVCLHGDSFAMSPLITPFWFKQRQCKAEPIGEAGQMLKVSGPNLPDAYLSVTQDNDRWRASVRRTQDGPDIAVSDSDSSKLAWEAAFELYRTHMIS
jgi:hypothetical protein